MYSAAEILKTSVIADTQGKPQVATLNEIERGMTILEPR
jgi:hypothetical protein